LLLSGKKTACCHTGFPGCHDVKKAKSTLEKAKAPKKPNTDNYTTPLNTQTRFYKHNIRNTE